jgi:hypothetical protein
MPRHPISPNQLVLWTRYQLVELITLALLRRSTAHRDKTKTRPRSGRLQAVTRRVVARIRENCRELFEQVRRGFRGLSPRWR